MIIIVGGGGFLGSHLRLRLAASSMGDVFVVAQHELPFPLMSHERQISRTDFAEAAGLEPIRKARAIVYLATASTVATFVESPWRELPENVEPFMQLLSRAGSVNPACKLVFISSGGSIYGPVNSLTPITEDHPLRPISPYGLGKLMQEAALEFAHRTSGLGYNVLRIANPVGVYGRSLYQGLVTAALRAVASGKPLTLFGDGSHVRDIIDADDAADAIVMAVGNETHRAATWNIGSGHGVSNRQVLDMVERVTGQPVPLDKRPARDADVPFIVLDTTRARTELGWRASRDVESTIRAIWHNNFLSSESSHI